MSNHPVPTPHDSQQVLDYTHLEVANKVGDTGRRDVELSVVLHLART